MPNNPDNRILELEKELKDLKDAFYTNNFSSSQDFNKYSRFNTRLRVPVRTSAPVTCEVGELHVISSTGKIYVCSSANTWSLVGTQS